MLIEHDNPFSTPLVSTCCGDVLRRSSSGISPWLWVLWGVSLAGIPLMMGLQMMGVQELVIGNHNSRFWIGWLHFLPYVSALVIPFFARVSVPLKFVYFFCSILLILGTLLGSILLLVDVFGFLLT